VPNQTQEKLAKKLDQYEFGFHVDSKPVFKSEKGLTEEIVRSISAHKKEPEWMLDLRLKALKIYHAKPMPIWGGDLSGIDFDNIHYYIKPSDRPMRSWDDVPAEIKDTFERLGVPEAERKFLSGSGAQFECLAADTMVFTNPGLKRIADIKKDQYVYSLDEKTKKIVRNRVKRVVCKGERPVFEVSVAGRKVKATQNHPFLAMTAITKAGKVRRNFEAKWLYLNDLKSGDYIAIAKNIPDNGQPYRLPKLELEKIYAGKNQIKSYMFFSNKKFLVSQKNLQVPKYSNEDLLWFLGLYLGDGCTNRKRKDGDRCIIDLAIPKKDSLCQKKLQKIVQKVFRYDLKEEKDIYRMRIHSLPLTQWLLNLGFSGSAKTKKLPNWLYSLPKSQKLSFIAGYIDSDGYVRDDKKNSDAIITSANKQLLTEIQKLAIGCGLNTSGVFEFKTKYIYKEKEKIMIGYRILLTGDLMPLKGYSLKVKKSFKPRKFYHAYNSYDGSPLDFHTSNEMGFASIKSIEPAGNEVVYDIEVENSHNFIAEGVFVHNSEMVYHNLAETLSKKGVIFEGTDAALQKYPEFFKEYFGTIVPPGDNKFAALNSAVWSGGSFIYIPKGVHIELPLQAYFRINAENMGQFERTLIIADEGSSVHYVEGCSAPTYSADSLHSAVVEIIVKKGARVQYTTIQNWSNNVYNLVTKRAMAYRDATMFWLDCNLGSKLTMKYPSVIMREPGAKGEVLSVAFAGKGQHQDAGAKMIHLAPNTSSTITSKSISKGGGRTSYRGLVRVTPGAKDVKCRVVCDALLLDPDSRSDTYPTMDVQEDNVSIAHEATVSKIGEEQLFYLMSRGLSEQEAATMIVNGFIDPIIKTLPMEYAIEMNRLIELEMTGSVG